MGSVTQSHKTKTRRIILVGHTNGIIISI
jgi:hypothetical protein